MQGDNFKPIIQFVDPQPREDVGSLLRLFQYEHFTIDMCVSYLYQKKQIRGIHDFLINKLYSYSDYDVNFFLPELCYILIKYKSPALQKFIMDKCGTNIPMFLKIYWCLDAYGQCEKKFKRFQYITDLLKKAETSMVSGGPLCRLSGGMSPDRISKGLDDKSELIKSEAHKKKLKADYLAYTNKFINILTSASLKLKALEGPKRKPQLKEYLKRINKWVRHTRKKAHTERDDYLRNLFYGVNIPFEPTDKEDKSFMVVNILEDEVTCFNTKKRAPYKIVVECVDMEEVAQWNTAMLGRTSNLSNPSAGRPSTLQRVNSQDPDASFDDNFEDILEEHHKTIKEKENKENQTINIDEIENKEKYQGLVDFNNFIKGEQEKARAQAQAQQTTAPTEAEIIQKYDFFQVAGKSQSQDEGTHLLIDQENKSNPPSPTKQPAPLTNARKSLAGKRPQITIGKVLSDDNMNNSQTAGYMEAMNKDLLGGIHTKIEGAIEEVKSDANSDMANSVEINKSFDGTEKDEPVLGWGPWDELWEFKKNKIREKSAFGHFKSYKLRCLVIKANDDLRQELITMQIINKFQEIWKKEGLNLRIKPYDILVTSEDSGILELVTDTTSLDGLKKTYKGKTLIQYYKETYGRDFDEAQKNFIDSLAPYCLICYFLQIKDRHNGNILIDSYGNIVHIDFGFILTTSPGGINFESAPFKLTYEYVELMGGPNSIHYEYFKKQLARGFMALRRSVDTICFILQVFMEGSDLTCFDDFNLQEFRDRFRENSTDIEAIEHVSRLADLSYNNWRTVQYDNFQKFTNGVLP